MINLRKIYSIIFVLLMTISPLGFAKTADQIIKEFCEEAKVFVKKNKRNGKPRAMLMAGQPGAGKSSVKAFLSSFKNNSLSQFLNIDPDEFRVELDEYLRLTAAGDYVGAHDNIQKDVIKMRDEAIACAVQLKADIAIDGTMAGYDGNKAQIVGLRKNGYIPWILYVEVDGEISEKRVKERFAQTKRLVPDGKVQALKKKVPEVMGMHLRDGDIVMVIINNNIEPILKTIFYPEGKITRNFNIPLKNSQEAFSDLEKNLK